jgi:uncharacterized membrane protein YvbJ
MAPNFCPACGRPQDPENRFCPQCGRRFAEEAAAARPAAPGIGRDQPPPAEPGGGDLLAQLRQAEREYSRHARRRSAAWATGCLTVLIGLAALVWVIGRGGCAAVTP